MKRPQPMVVVAAAGVAILAGCAVGVSGTTPSTSDTSSSSKSPTPSKKVTPTPSGLPSWTPPPGDKTVYLTFDDGPSSYTEKVLDVLKENDVKATFFIIGKMVRTREATRQRIYDEGHGIGNHTYDHVDLRTLAPAKIRYQLEMTQKQLGARAGHCMRPPFGSIGPESREVSQSLGLTPVKWTRDTRDWETPVESSIYSILINTKPGDIVLMHDGGGDRKATVDAVRDVLPKLKARGYKFGVIPVCAQPNQAS